MTFDSHLRDPKVLCGVFESLGEELIAQIRPKGIDRAQKLGCKSALQLLARRRCIRDREPSVTSFSGEVVSDEAGGLKPARRLVPFMKKQLQVVITSCSNRQSHRCMN